MGPRWIAPKGYAPIRSEPFAGDHTILDACVRRTAVRAPEIGAALRRATALRRREPWRGFPVAKTNAGSSYEKLESTRTQSGGRRDVTGDKDKMPWPVADDGSPACGGDKREHDTGLGLAC
jgi:hypothetical protein